MTDANRIFIDTSAWIEFILKKEKYHKLVFDFLISEVRKGSKVFTSDYVLNETFTRLLTNQSFWLVKSFRSKIEELEAEQQIIVLWTDEVLFNKAWANFEKFREHKLSFTDAVIATIVKDLKIDEVLTLDGGFKKIGLVVKPLID